jgi:hypothetical protein
VGWHSQEHDPLMLHVTHPLVQRDGNPDELVRLDNSKESSPEFSEWMTQEL